MGGTPVQLINQENTVHNGLKESEWENITNYWRLGKI
jgi:hypothetical protein